MKITENKALNGIEVSFEERPNAQVLGALKEHGFRWHRVKRLWYAKKNAERVAMLEGLKGGTVVHKKGTERKNAYFEVGDILYCSWGYSMTLYDFVQVRAVTEKSIKVKYIQADVVGGDFMRPKKSCTLGTIYPDSDCEWRKVNGYRTVKGTDTGQPYIVVGDHYFEKYNGQILTEDHWD